jgi:hypothetical protein
MRFVLALAAMACGASPATAAGYALHGTFYDYSASSTARLVPAVLYVSIRDREARLRISAPEAGCVPELGESRYVGRARGGAPEDLAAHVVNKGNCPHISEDARLFLHVNRGGVVERAELTDHVRRIGGPLLFRTN